MNNKLLMLTNVLFLGGAIFFGLKYFKERVRIPDLKPEISKQKCTDCSEYNNVKASSKLDVNLLRAMTYNYQYDPVADQIDHNKTRSVWVSLEKLKQFVYDIEKGTCYCPKSQLGVRVYFGVYPQDQDWLQSSNANGFWTDLNNPNAPDGDFRDQIIQKNQTSGNPLVNNYAGITTIFMVPTIGSGGVNYDFDPANNSKNCKGGYTSIEFYRNMDSAKFANPNTFLHSRANASITALSATNHGDACPPPVRGCQQLGSYEGFDH